MGKVVYSESGDGALTGSPIPGKVEEELIDFDYQARLSPGYDFGVKPEVTAPRETSTNSCCKDSLAVIVEKEYQSVSKQINNHTFPNSPSISCTILGTFLKIQNINENDLANLELLVPSYQNYGINFIISLAAVKVVLIDLTPNTDVRVAGLNQIMDNYISYNEARHELPIGKFKPFTYDVNDSKFNKSVPEITDTLSEVDVHCLTTYGHVKNYDIVLSFSNEGLVLARDDGRIQGVFVDLKPDVHFDSQVSADSVAGTGGARHTLDPNEILIPKAVRLLPNTASYGAGADTCSGALALTAGLRGVDQTPDLVPRDRLRINTAHSPLGQTYNTAGKVGDFFGSFDREQIVKLFL